MKRANNIIKKQFSVKTADNIDVNFIIAGIGSRMIAYLWDFFFRYIFMIGIFAIIFIVLQIYRINPLKSEISELNTFLLFSLVMQNIYTILYYIFFEIIMNGRTPGKKLAGIRVISNNGTRADWKSILLRNILRIIDNLPFFYLTGIITMLVTKDEKRIGDLAAGTVVIREERKFGANSNQKTVE